ncbi:MULTISPECIES: ABC transporter permease [unclassified Jeotgalibaca]|uniref:ABC transporter permease n=1 Tax=unclassified Jeotgalibaca TaxID=2621505 RepID=UPI003FD1E399
MSKFWVIVSQVYRKNVKSLGFVTMMLSPIVLLAIIAGIFKYIENIETAIPNIAVFSDSQAVVEILQQEEESFTVEAGVKSVEDAEKLMELDGLDGYLTVSQENKTFNASYVHLADSQSFDLNYLGALLSNLQINLQAEELGLSPQEINALSTPPIIETNTISFDDGQATYGDQTEQNVKIGAAYAISIAIFTFIMTYSSIIAEEIASEKGTRIMEVILSSVNSTTHFFGKLTAIFLICLTQVAFYAVMIVIALQFDIVTDLLPEGINIFETLSAIIGVSMYYFIMGIFLYAVIAAFLGSLVSKIEDVSKAVTPIVFIALIGFYGGMFAFVNTTHPIIKIGSHIPPFTPFIMPFRIAADTVSISEIWISVVAMLAFTILITFISLMLYRSNVLIYSDAGMFKTIQTSIRNIRNDRAAAKK